MLISVLLSLTLNQKFTSPISGIHNNYCTYSSLTYLQELEHIEYVTYLSQWCDEFTPYSPLSVKQFLLQEIIFR